MRMSLRELFAILAACAVGSAALRNVNHHWVTGATVVVLLTFLAMTIESLVARGPRQARAIGVLTAMVLYGWLFDAGEYVATGGAVHRELDPDRGVLPTSQLLGIAYRSTVQFWHVDRVTGEPTVKAAWNGYQTAPKGMIGLPPADDFMVVGHCWWAIALGYVGGLYARFVYGRRARVELLTSTGKEMPSDREDRQS
jgi:hypothetical protein